MIRKVLKLFNDERSKSVVFVAHCILNQNAISDGTANFKGTVCEIVDLLSRFGVGIIQMPCPELQCLGLDRGNVRGRFSPVVEENTRIRSALVKKSAAFTQLVHPTVFQISEYQKHNFRIIGIIGINRSPSCGVETTSDDNQEIEGRGLFIEVLKKELEKRNVRLNFIGIKPFEMEKALTKIKNLLHI